MLADVGMVKTYSKSAHVNDLGFAWTGPPSCCMDRPAPSLHGPALLLVPKIFPPGGFAIPCRYTLHHPYICPCFLVSLLIMECKLLMGESTFKASKQQWQ